MASAPNRLPTCAALLCLLALAGCRPPSHEPARLPTGARLDPAGHSLALGSMPLAMAWSGDSARIAVLLCGYRAQGVQIVDPARGLVTQTLVQPAAFIGLAFAPNGRSLFTSGGDRDVVYRYAWAGDSARLADSLRLEPGAAREHGDRYPAGLALSPDGRWLYVAENLADSLAVIDVAARRVVQRVATGRYPYAVVVGPEGRVYVSAWGGDAVATFTPEAGRLRAGARIAVGRHPSALALDARDARLYVARASFDAIAVVDTRRDRLLKTLSDALPGAPPEGGTPNALALSPDGRRLYVAEADHDAVAVFDVSGGDSLLGRVPVEWYPCALLMRGDRLYALNGKGRGTGPNPGLAQPGHAHERDPLQYTLGQLSGSLTTFAAPTAAQLAAYSRRVARSQGWDSLAAGGTLPPFQHVVYVIRENRTYDQVFGDLAAGDGDTSLVYFPRAITPNAHALAERCGLFDRFFTNAEVSGQGHDWSTAAYAPDYVEKTIPSNYSERGRTYDYEGENRDEIPEDDVDEPGTGYLWDAAARAGVSVRDYGEYVVRDSTGRWVPTKRALASVASSTYPGWDLAIPDQRRLDLWLAEFRRCEAADSLPALTILRLPNDHTAGAHRGAPTPRAYVADNDLALGRLVETLSRSRFWASTVVFVLEDDSQDGPDHVDSHRSPLLVVSAWSRPGAVHRFANTTDVLATIARILHMDALSDYDFHGRPLSGIFAAAPDTRPFVALKPGVSLEEKNGADSTATRQSERLDLRREDAGDQALLSRILWRVAKGAARPYPGTHHLAVLPHP